MTESYKLSPWNLTELFPNQDGSEMSLALEGLERLTTEFEALRPSLREDIPAPEFLDIIGRLEKLNNALSRVRDFAYLRFAADTQDQAIQSFLAQTEQLAANLGNRLLFFELWWKGLDASHTDRLMAQAGDYSYWLEEMRHFKPHTLSEAEEKIVNLKNVTGAQALNNLYNTITNRYIFHLTVDGEERELTRGELMVFARHPDPDLRARAYQELYRVYSQEGTILGLIYQSLVRDWRNEQVDLRRFVNPNSARNLQNNIPDPVVDTLLEVCQRNAGIFRRYFRLKSRLIGVLPLRRYDIYAPVSTANKTYEFPQAVEQILEAFGQFDLRLATLAHRVFEQDHLDSEIRKGKDSGAFCATVTPELTPWVLINFQGKPDDVATLAHELGHAIHSLLADHHTLFTQHASLPLAETASTFGEMLLVDYLLANENDPGVRRDLLFRQVDNAYATIMRQAFFALFERQAHEMIVQGASVDELSAAYMQNLSEQFGEAVQVADEFRWEWVAIPHIYSVPFYVYAYAFGQLLVLSLYQQYKEQGEAFKPRYLKILSAGGSDAPVRILAEAGIDVYRAEFWQGGFDVLDRLVTQLENLPG